MVKRKTKNRLSKGKALFSKFLVLLSLVSIVLFPVLPTISFYNDTEASSNNSLQAASLDLTLTSSLTEFTGSTGMEPGDSASRDFSIGNAGDLSFEHSQEYSNPTGDLDLCNSLNLEVLDGATVVYSGLLSSYSFTAASSLAPTLSKTYDYTVTLPASAASSLRNKSCQFDIEAKAWPVGGTYGMGFFDTETLTSVITSGNWPPPAPILTSPADGTVAGVGSAWTATPVMDWADVVWVDPTLYYVYQSSLGSAVNPDGSFTVPAYTSGSLLVSQISAAGTPNGTYYWHVQACDTTWGCGGWSTTWSLIVDNTIQEASLGDVIVNEIMWMGSNTSTADEWIELYNPTASAINLKNWVIENAGSGSSAITIPTGSIPAGGYFLIANYSAANPSSALAVEGDFITASFSLDNAGEQLTLKDAMGNTIDQTPAGAWTVGVNTTLKQSMERNNTPGDGTVAGNWHTCIDVGCNDLAYWDLEADDYGTPKAINLSSNDPTSLAPIAPSISQTSLQEIVLGSANLGETVVVSETPSPLPVVGVLETVETPIPIPTVIPLEMVTNENQTI